MPRCDMEGAVADPIGAAYNTLRDSVDGVFDAMGGGEGQDVGALLWEILRAAITKDGDEVSDLMHDFRHFGRAPADTMQLQEFHEDWVGLLEEVRFSPWCSDEGVLDQAMTAFQHYGPELRRAEREARSSGSLNGNSAKRIRPKRIRPKRI